MAQENIRNRTKGGGGNGFHELTAFRVPVDGNMEYWGDAGLYQLQPDGGSIDTLCQVLDSASTVCGRRN